MTKLGKLTSILLLICGFSPMAFAEKYYTTDMSVAVRYSDLEAQQNEEYVGQVVKYRVRFTESGTLVNFYELQEKIVFTGELSSTQNSTFEDGGIIAKDLDEQAQQVYIGSKDSKKGFTKGNEFFMEACEMKVNMTEAFARTIGKQSIQLAWDRQGAASAQSTESTKAMDLLKTGDGDSADLSIATGLSPLLVNIKANPECANVAAVGPSEVQFHKTYKMKSGQMASHSAHVVIQFSNPEVRNNL